MLTEIPGSVYRWLFTFVEFPPFSLNFVVETSAEDFILRSERRAQNFLKNSATPKSLHLKALAFDPFCAHRTTHGLALVFGIRGGSGIADWVTRRSQIISVEKKESKPSEITCKQSEPVRTLSKIDNN